MKSTYAGLLLLAAISTPALAARNCAPEKIVCGDEPRTYGCPPCPKYGALKNAGQAEDHRQDLEGYRVSLDKSLKSGDIGMVGYRDGMKAYKEAIGSVRAASGK